MDAQFSGSLQNEIVRRVFAYWNERRGARFAPARAELDPVDFAYALADVALADVIEGPPLRFRYRLVGHNLVVRDGYNMRGKFLDELPEPEYRERVRRAWTEVVETRRPVHHIRTAVFDGRSRRYESLVLPLSADGARVGMVLGVQRHL
jgi:hypothetical protein